MNPLRLAVISDIHVGAAARAKDLCPAGTRHRDEKPDDAYRKIFCSFLRKRKISADYIVIPGDVTDKAKPAEAEIASDFIKEVCSALELTAMKVVFVPGNHDVSWLRKSQRYNSLKHDKFCFNSIISRGVGCVFDAPHFTIWNDPAILVLGYNSSHHDKPKKLHHGLVDPKHLDEMRDALTALSNDDGKVRLFLVHHHPLQYDMPGSVTPDPSIMVNGEKLQALLRDFKFDLVIHGHKHLPRFTTHSINGSSELAFLCSGSFSVEIDTQWAGSVTNQFHLVTIEGRDERDHVITGFVESWAYNHARGWVESNPLYDGIAYREPFGNYTRPEALKSTLRPLIAAKLNADNFVEWNFLASENPKLLHMRPETLNRVLDELAPELSFRRMHDDPSKILLLKNEHGNERTNGA